MLWKDREGSSNVEDRRGEGGGFGGGGPEIPYAERQAGISCLSGRFSCPAITASI